MKIVFSQINTEMKGFILTIAIVMVSMSGMAQKYAYVDTDFILENIPEYNEAQEKINELSEQWQKEIETRYEIIDQKKKAFQEEALLMPDEMKKKKQAEIESMEKGAIALQKKRFGVNGDLFNKRKELIKPIQDRVFDAIQTIANKMKISFIFDKANQSTLLFADPRFDRSENVLLEMGINPNANK